MRYAIISEVEVDGGKRRTCVPRTSARSPVDRRVADDPEDAAKGRRVSDRGGMRVTGSIRC